MTQHIIETDKATIDAFYAKYPMFNPYSKLFQKPAFDVLNAWVDLNPGMDATDEKQFASFLRWLQQPQWISMLEQQVKAAGGTLDLTAQPAQGVLYAQFTQPMGQVSAVHIEPEIEEDNSDPIPGIPLPHPVERFLKSTIIALDPDAEVTARLVAAYFIDVGTSILTGVGNTWGQAPLTVFFSVLLNVMGSFAEIIFRYGITMLMRGFRFKTRTAGDMGVLAVYLLMSLFVVCISAGGYVYNLLMTVSFFHNWAPAAIRFFDFDMPISIGATFGLVIVAVMSVIQLEYVLKQATHAAHSNGHDHQEHEHH